VNRVFHARLPQERLVGFDRKRGLVTTAAENCRPAAHFRIRTFSDSFSTRPMLSQLCFSTRFPLSERILRKDLSAARKSSQSHELFFFLPALNLSLISPSSSCRKNEHFRSLAQTTEANDASRDVKGARCIPLRRHSPGGHRSVICCLASCACACALAGAPSRSNPRTFMRAVFSCRSGCNERVRAARAGISVIIGAVEILRANYSLS